MAAVEVRLVTMDYDSAAVDALVAAAGAGDEQAWNAIIARFAPLVWSVCRAFRLSEAEAADVSQTVWLRTVERLGSIRVPAALPGWLSTTTRHECLRIAASHKLTVSIIDEGTFAADSQEAASIDAELLAVERRAVVRECLAQLPSTCRQLLVALSRDEHRSYGDISLELAMPVGSIGPTRQRCLQRLKRCSALRQWADPELDGASRV